MNLSQVAILPSDGGRFEVTVDGVLVFSKLAENRFPEHDEIKAHLYGKSGGGTSAKAGRADRRWPRLAQ